MKINSVVKDAALAVICLLLLIPTLIYGFPFLAGADSSYTVMSGSMRPTLKPGDLILVKQIDPATVEVDDIVTVKYETEVFTHRVFEKKFEDGVYLFKTKGDANEDPDPSWWNASEIMGKTFFVIPLGHLYSPHGYTLSFLLPCVVLFGKQMYHVFSVFKPKSKRKLRKWRRQKHPVLDTTSVLLLLILVMSGSWLMAPYFQLGSFSYFSDSEWAEATFTAGTWFPRFYAEGCGCMFSHLVCGRGNLTSNRETITLKIKDQSRSWEITDYEICTGLNGAIHELVQRLNGTWYEKIVEKIGSPDGWVVETYFGQSDTEELRVKVFNGKYVFSYSYNYPLTLKNVNSFFVGKIPES